MDDLITFLNRTNNVWFEYGSTSRSNLDVSELQYHVEDTDHKLTHQVVRQNEAERWAKSTHAERLSDQQQQGSLRVVWIRHNSSEKVDDISVESLNHVLDAFELGSAYQYSRTAFAGAAAFPRDASSSMQTFATGTHPKLVVLWSHASDTKDTKAIFFASQTCIEQLKEVLSTRWSFAMEPLFPAFICALNLGREIDDDQSKIKQEIREVEVRTGYHRWAGRVERPATGDLAVLSAKMSGCATKMASVTRKTRFVQHLHKFILSNLPAPDVSQQHTAARQRVLDLQSATALLSSRAEMQTVDTDFIQHRISVQLTALQHLIQQNDTLISQSVAQDSRVLAMASQRDSSSMKTLAVVTMFFLPGTFVASVFSMPYFVFDASRGEVMLHRNLGIYWAVTVPLTLLTLFSWTGWTLWRDWRDRREEKIESAKLQKSFDAASAGCEPDGARGWEPGSRGGASEIQNLVRRKTALERQKTA